MFIEIVSMSVVVGSLDLWWHFFGIKDVSWFLLKFLDCVAYYDGCGYSVFYRSINGYRVFHWHSIVYAH